MYLHILTLSSILVQVYIQYINFSRRVNGVKGARAVFKKAREDSRCGYHVRTRNVIVLV